MRATPCWTARLRLPGPARPCAAYSFSSFLHSKQRFTRFSVLCGPAVPNGSIWRWASIPSPVRRQAVPLRGPHCGRPKVHDFGFLDIVHVASRMFIWSALLAMMPELVLTTLWTRACAGGEHSTAGTKRTQDHTTQSSTSMSTHVHTLSDLTAEQRTRANGTPKTVRHPWPCLLAGRSIRTGRPREAYPAIIKYICDAAAVRRALSRKVPNCSQRAQSLRRYSFHA
jgi:hypothetical protein